MLVKEHTPSTGRVLWPGHQRFAWGLCHMLTMTWRLQGQDSTDIILMRWGWLKLVRVCWDFHGVGLTPNDSVCTHCDLCCEKCPLSLESAYSILPAWVCILNTSTVELSRAWLFANFKVIVENMMVKKCTGGHPWRAGVRNLISQCTV